MLGSNWLVEAAVSLARRVGVSELVIGLTIIAAGTSLPEVATSVLATLRGERDIAVGNVVGSNTFNILGVLGVSAVVAPVELPVPTSLATFDLPIMLAVAIACLPVFFTGRTIARWEGGVFLGYYGAYAAYLILDAQEHDLLTTYTLAMRWVVIPLTVLTLAVVLARGAAGAAPLMLLLVVALPLAAALLLTLLAARPATPTAGSRDVAIGIALVATLSAGAALVALAPGVFAGELPAVATAWLPPDIAGAGADLGLRLDGLALLFATLVTGIGALVILYARYYLDSSEPAARFLAAFMAFMAAMLGLVLADNLLLLAICWELTSLASFLLIGHWRDQADARRGARMALLVTGAGGLALLAGVLLLGQMAGSFKLDVVLAAGDRIRADPAYVPMLLLILLAVFTKSAQFPWHFWLPEAMAAPTPVSAYLHSATLVKAGIFLMARLHPALAGTDLWFWVVGGTGLVTLLGGAYLAVFQHDLKGLLAYSTISHLGLITLLFGLDDPLATVAAIFHTLNHATFKASLFMAAGAIDHETGSRDMRQLNGLWPLMPVTAVLAITSTLAMAGVPLLNGFLSKEMFFAETLLVERHGLVQVAVPLLATLAGAFSVAYSARFVHDVFWNGEPRNLPRPPHDPPRWMLVPIGVLALLCVLVGLFPEVIVGRLLATAAQAAVGGPLPAYTLEIWHGFSLPLLMSALATTTGVVFYFFLQRLFHLHDRVHLPKGGREIFAGLLDGATRLASWLTNRVFAPTLRRSVLGFLCVALAAGTWPLVDGGLLPAESATGGDGTDAGRRGVVPHHCRLRPARGALPGPAHGPRPGRRHRTHGHADVRGPLGAGPGPDAAPRGGRVRHPAAARAELPPRHERVAGRRRTPLAGRDPRGSRGPRRGGARLGRAGPPEPDDRGLVPGERRAGRRGNERGERHHRRLSRAGHAR